MRFWVGFDHAANYRSKLALDAEEALKEGSRSFDAASLIRSVSLEVVSVLGIETEAIVVVISFYPHLLAQLDCILVAKEGKLSSPLKDNHNTLHWPSAWAFSTFDDFYLQLACKAFEVAALLQHQLHLQIVLQQWIIVLQLSNYIVANLKDAG